MRYGYNGNAYGRMRKANTGSNSFLGECISILGSLSSFVIESGLHILLGICIFILVIIWSYTKGKKIFIPILIFIMLNVITYICSIFSNNTDISKATVSGIKNMAYTGKALEQPWIIVQAGKSTLTEDLDYYVKYKRNTKIGTAKVVITGKGNYTGSVSKSFKIVIKKGKVYTVDRMKYKVTNNSIGGKGTVALIGSKSKKEKMAGKLKVADTIKICGKSFRVTSIGEGAFKGYNELTNLVIGKNVTVIGKEAFCGCNKIASVSFGTSIGTISKMAFYKCTSLGSITFPSKVNKIGTQAFYGCKDLKKININTKKLTSKKVGNKAFEGIYKETKVNVPNGKMKVYGKMLRSKGIDKAAQIKE